MITLPQSRVALANGIELDVVDMGPRDAPALIFLHGFPENHRTWRHQIAHFSDRYRCIAPDQRGYRGSSKPSRVKDYDASLLIGDVFQLADALGIERFTIVGHDWGGAIAWGVAITGQMTGRVERAIIANAPHPLVFQRLLFTDEAQRSASQYMRAFRDPAHDALVQEQGLRGLLDKATDWVAATQADPQERAILEADWKNREAAIAMLNWYRASRIEVPDLEAPYAIPKGWSAPTLPNLAIPTLVVWGLEDTALPPGNISGLLDVVDDFTLAEIPGAGHFVPWEDPEPVTAAMEEFLPLDG